jgi:hypothetical protein
MTIPTNPKIYHILHVDRLESVLKDGHLWADSVVIKNGCPGTVIGMDAIKERRMKKNELASHPGLMVGDCVPFYFCPRSIMLYLIYQGNHPELTYRGGQGPIIHLEADLLKSVAAADGIGRRWAFTLSNAGSFYFEDRADLARLGEINWDAVNAMKWSGPGVESSVKEGKQAEFLMENSFPWHLFERIGVQSEAIYKKVSNLMAGVEHRPQLEIRREWYY